MTEKRLLFNCSTDQRYYHFVAFRDRGHYGFSQYWRQVADVAPLLRTGQDISTTTFEAQHRQLKTDRVYARGNILEVLSETKDGNPPYLYDLFAIKTRLRKDSYFMFAFPFLGLGKYLMDDLILQHRLLRYGDLQSVDVGVLLKRLEDGAETRFRDLVAHAIGLRFVVADDKCLSGMRLGGDDPLNSKIYRGMLRAEVSGGSISPDLCVLACEEELGDTTGNIETHAHSAVRSRLHVDVFGHFKFYAHIGFNNMLLIPHALELLSFLKCFRKTSENPLRRAEQEELER